MTDHQQFKMDKFYSYFPYLFFTLAFFTIWIWIKPQLIYMVQQPVFFFSSLFFHERLAYPGGLCDYASALLMQFYAIPAIGALIITFTIAAIYFATKHILRAFKKNHPDSLYFIPAIILFGMSFHYSYPLSFTLSLLVSLLFFLLYSRLPFQQAVVRAIAFLIFCLALYYIAAGPFLVFSALCLLFELIKIGHFWLYRIALAAIIVLTAFLIPRLLSSYFFLISSKDIYTYLLPFSLTYKLFFLPHLLYLFFPLAALGLAIAPGIRLRNDEKTSKRPGLFLAKTRSAICQTLIVLVLAGVIALFSADQQSRTLQQVEYFALQGKWDKILETVRGKSAITYRVVALQMNRALYHSGKMAQEMFAFPQNWGIAGLLMTHGDAFTTPLENSDIMFELGQINSAESWAFEALTLMGETPRILKRLALIHLLKNEYPAATRCLELLKKTVFHKKWAQHYLDLMAQPESLQQDSQLQQIRPLMIRSDFLIRAGYAKVELEKLLQNNTYNKMAFEYLAAYDLLSGRLNHFMENIEHLTELDYTAIPIHYEEAIVLYMAINSLERIRLPLPLRQETIQRFEEFAQILSRFGNDKLAARDELQKKFGDTYWFFYLYAVQPENQT
jgi:hypothetical protein